MENSNLAPLFTPALRHKDFPEVGLSKQKLHVWGDLTGYQPEGGRMVSGVCSRLPTCSASWLCVS
jgi:hypothetical protein